jgi:hypothetical protein
MSFSTARAQRHLFERGFVRPKSLFCHVYLLGREPVRRIVAPRPRGQCQKAMQACTSIQLKLLFGINHEGRWRMVKCRLFAGT